MEDKIFLEDLKVPCIIGIFNWERKKTQKVLINLEFPADIRKAARHDDIRSALDYKKISKQTRRFVETSRFFLIETLAEKTAGMILREFPLAWIKVRVSKPGAIRGARNVGVEITRFRPRRHSVRHG